MHFRWVPRATSTTLLLAVVASAFAGCGDDDAGATDSGLAPTDAGAARDAGAVRDAGSAGDAGPRDAGMVIPSDAGPPCMPAPNARSIGARCTATGGECPVGYECSASTSACAIGCTGACACPAPTTCNATGTCECPVQTCLIDSDCGDRAPCVGAAAGYPGVCNEPHC